MCGIITNKKKINNLNVDLVFMRQYSDLINSNFWGIFKCENKSKNTQMPKNEFN